MAPKTSDGIEGVLTWCFFVLFVSTRRQPRHAAGKTVVLREVPACSSQALAGVVPQVDDHTQRLLTLLWLRKD